MHSSPFRTSASALLGFALVSGVSAGAMLENKGLAAKIQKADVHFETGNYIVRNVKTGMALTVEHRDYNGEQNKVGVWTDSPDNTVRLETVSSTQSVDGDMTGTLISGSTDSGDMNCLASQWSTERGAGLDLYGTPYPCTLGSTALASEDYESVKTQWSFLPVGSNSDDEGDNDDDDDESTASVANVKAAVKVAAAPSSTADFTSAAPVASASKAPSIDCPKAGDWISRHPEYVDNHPDCKGVLDAYKATLSRRHRMVKRSVHAKLAKSIKKRGQTVYQIIPNDHLTNMATRALTGHNTKSWRDVSALYIEERNPNDDAQLWTVTKA